MPSGGILTIQRIADLTPEMPVAYTDGGVVIGSLDFCGAQFSQVAGFVYEFFDPPNPPEKSVSYVRASFGPMPQRLTNILTLTVMAPRQRGEEEELRPERLVVAIFRTYAAPQPDGTIKYISAPVRLENLDMATPGRKTEKAYDIDPSVNIRVELRGAGRWYFIRARLNGTIRR